MVAAVTFMEGRGREEEGAANSLRLGCAAAHCTACLRCALGGSSRRRKNAWWGALWQGAPAISEGVSLSLFHALLWPGGGGSTFKLGG